MNDWYAGLNRPVLTPPDWVFAPVWTVLYVMIGISIFLFLKNYRSERGRIIYEVLILHVICNVSWTSFFFGLQSPLLALFDIILIDISLVWMVWFFWTASRLSSILLWPYLAWVFFATYLNVSFYLLNKT